MKKMYLLGILFLALVLVSSSAGAEDTGFIIPAGDDHFRVVDAGFDMQLPADFFGPGSGPFEGTIICGEGGDSSVDITIKRLGDINLPPSPSEDTIPIEIIELNLVSCQPIVVNNNDGNQQQWDVQVGLSPTAPPLGQMTVRRTHENGGAFDSHLPVQPRFIFTPVDDSHEDIRFIDDLIIPLEAFDVPWQTCPSTNPEFSFDFCPESFRFFSDESWLNLEPVMPALPDEDNCPNDPDNDADDDGICGEVDSCPLENPEGLDADSDGCTDTIEGLYDSLQSTEIQAGVKNSLLAKVNNALSSLTTERVNTAINQLSAFINQVEAQSGKKISQEDATVLTNFAQNIIQVNNVQLACIQPPSGIIGWWSGDNALDLINGNNAVLHDDAGFAAGKVGNAFNLDGIGDYASIPYSSDLDPSEITVEFWVSGPQMNQQPGNTGSGVTLIENSPIHADFEGWTIFLTPSGGIGTTIGNGVQWNPVISNFGLPPSGWRHVAMTYDGTYLQLYLNGVPQLGPAGNLVSNAQLSTGRDINIGASWNNGSFARFFKGLIDEVEIYDRALSVAEIQSIYNAGSAGKCKPNVCVAPPSDLVGWWTMDDAASSPIADDRAGGNDGIVNGATLGVSGKVSTAADFDGVDDYIEVPDNADLNITDAITIDAWVKLDSLPNSNALKTIVSDDELGGNPLGYALSVGATGFVFFHYAPVGPSLLHFVSSTGSLSIGVWHHVAATLDSNANVMNIYIDGQLDKQVSFNMPPIDPSSGPLLIGSTVTTPSAANFDGKIDELEIFNRALSPFEIWAMYNAGTAGKCKPLTPVPGPGDAVE